MNLDRGGQTIGTLNLADSGSGGYTIGRNGGSVVVDSAPLDSFTITLASPPPSNFVVGTEFMGSWVTAISGTTVTLASKYAILPTDTAWTITSPTTLPFGNALTFDVVSVTPNVMIPGQINVTSGNHEIAAPVVIKSGLNVDVASGSTLKMTGSVTSGFNVGNGLTKTGAGTLELNGVTAHTGPTIVNGGTLRGTGSLPTSAVTVNSGGRLGAGTTLATGILTLGNGLTLTSGSTFSVRINGTVPGTGFDQLVVTGGNVNLGNATFEGFLTGSYLPTDKLYIVNNTGSGTTSGTFNGIAQDDTITIGGYFAQISYVGDAGTNALTGGNDVVLYNLVPVPEPTTILGLSALGLVGFAGVRRRFRRSHGVVN